MHRGISLIEVVTVLSVVGILLLVATPRLSKWGDDLAVERATGEVASFYWTARMRAIFRGSRVRIEFGADSLRASFEGVTDSVFLMWPGPSRHGVSLRASRPVIRVYGNGMGLGAANTKLVLQRGAAAESLTTSRLGRLKRWN
ncbi:MAG: type II secretion system protein [Gemmatimonadales bacterium]|jgi:prepilin-type N-terminal cleavage/methylation domain-containing protein